MLSAEQGRLLESLKCQRRFGVESYQTSDT